MNESNISKAGEDKPSHIQKITPFLWFNNQVNKQQIFISQFLKIQK